MQLRSGLQLVGGVICGALTLAACSGKPLGEDRAKEQETKGKQQVETLQKKTDAAERSVQQSEQRINDAEKQLEQPQPAVSPTN